MDRDERGQYPAILTKQARPINNLLYDQKITKEFRFCGKKEENPKRARSAYLARSGSQPYKKATKAYATQQLCSFGQLIFSLI